MITQLQFTNFKSWERVSLAFGQVTGIFGTNSSGKTSLIQFLLLLKQTKDTTDRSTSLELNGSLVELGTIKDAIHKHDESRTIEFKLSFRRKEELVLADPEKRRGAALTKSHEFSITAGIDIHQKAPRARKLTYQVGDMKFSLAPKSRSGKLLNRMNRL